MFSSSFPDSLLPCSLSAPCASLWAWSARTRKDCLWCSCCDALLRPFSALHFPEQGHALGQLSQGLMRWTVEVQVAAFSLTCMLYVGWNPTLLSWKEKTDFFFSGASHTLQLILIHLIPICPYLPKAEVVEGIMLVLRKHILKIKDLDISTQFFTVIFFSTGIYWTGFKALEFLKGCIISVHHNRKKKINKLTKFCVSHHTLESNNP